MDDLNYYDEFGNYIGPDIEDDENVVIEEEPLDDDDNEEHVIPMNVPYINIYLYSESPNSFSNLANGLE